MTEKREIGKALHIFSHQIKRQIDHTAAEYGLTAAQARELGFIYFVSRERDVFQKDIEEAFDIRRSSVTNSLQILEKKGYIKRLSVAHDGRLKKLILTEEGLLVQKKVYNLLKHVEDELRAVVTQKELDLFFEILERFTKVVMK